MKNLLLVLVIFLALVSTASAKSNTSNYIVFDQASQAPNYGNTVTFDALGGTQIQVHCYQGRNEVYFSLNWNEAAYDSSGNFLGYGSASFDLTGWNGNTATCTASVGSWNSNHFHSTASIGFNVT